MAKTSGKSTRSPASKPSGNKKSTPTPKKAPMKRSALSVIMPYLLVVFALILAICFITVQLLGMDDGAGVIGYGIQWFFCGLLGGAAFLLPALLGYVGVLYMIFHIRWKPSDCDPNGASFTEYAKARRRLTVQTVMAFLAVFILAIMIASHMEMSGADIKNSSLGFLFLAILLFLVDGVVYLISPEALESINGAAVSLGLILSAFLSISVLFLLSLLLIGLIFKGIGMLFSR